MELKVGDRVRYVVQRDIDNVKVGEVGIIRDISSGGDYAVDFEESGFKHNCGGLCQSNHGWWCSGDTLEPVAPTLAEIKEKKLTCVIHTKTKKEAIMLVEILGVDEERLYGKNDFIECWDGHKENTCYRIRNGKIDQMDCVKFYQKINEEIYELPDLSELFTAWEQSHYSPKFMEKIIQKHDEMYRLTFKNGSSIEAIPQKVDTVREENHFCTGFEALYLDLSAFLNDGISAKNGGKNSMKFTFYVKEGTRPDKNPDGDGKGVIPTMTTTVVDASGKKATVTCDKADYNERQGVLEAIAQIACGGNFDKEYDKAVKKNKLIELHDRTCTYCGKVFDTIAEREAHESWHIERKKARRERYLLRKRAKEIAFEEQAQKMAKEMIKEDK